MAGDVLCRCQQSLVLVIVFCTAAARGSGFQIVKLHTSQRDYEVTSERYPDPYPSHENVSWRWNVTRGVWAVLFLDFQLTCDPTSHLTDRLVISQGLTFSCTSKPFSDYPYKISSPNFTIDFFSAGNPGQGTKGFKMSVLFGNNPENLNRKIDDWRIEAYKKNKAADASEQVPCLLYVIVLGILVVTTIVMVAWVCALQCRHQTLKASYAVSIRQTRRESPEGSPTQEDNPSPEQRDETRLNSSEPEPQRDSEITGPKRPVRRNDSDASWIMRAQMSVHKGSCTGSTNSISSSSRRFVARHRALSESGVRHQSGSNVSTLTLDSPDVSDDEGFEPSPPSSTRACRLGPLPEERLSRKTSMPTLRAAPVSECPLRSVDNAGYFLMSDTKHINSHR